VLSSARQGGVTDETPPRDPRGTLALQGGEGVRNIFWAAWPLFFLLSAIAFALRVPGEPGGSSYVAPAHIFIARPLHPPR